MKGNILNQLQELKPYSNKRIISSSVDGFSGYMQASGLNPMQLVKDERIANANWIKVPRYGGDSILEIKNRQSLRKIMTLSAGVDTNFTYRLNTALLGGESYPVLNWFLGAAAGMASGGAGFIFSVTTTAIDMGKTSHRVLARSGDEIWQVEEIGKVTSGADVKVMHVNSYFLADPYRGHAQGKGWLIHEERSELTLS